MRTFLTALVLGMLFVQPACVEPDTRGTELGKGWEFRQASKGPWRKAVVPGCVHTDLLANRVIGDPFFGTNEARLQWIESEDWEYRARLAAGPEIMAKERVELLFEGLDTYADVYLNDSLVVRADNMFRTWSVDCKGILRGGTNELRVRFRSPVKEVAERRRALGDELPGGPQVLARKAAYQYGWDFAPRFVTSGIWRPVRILAWNEARIADLWIVQRSVTDDRADLTARFEIDATAPRRAALEIREGGSPLARVETDLVAGKNDVSLDFSVLKPRLWWTNGLGESHLYSIRGVLASEGAVIDQRERRIGIRTLELVREPDARGTSFFFKLNGVPVFMKGANYVPQDCFPSRVTRERYESLLGKAADAGMNMLRVWGGGIYENDLFYDLCDEKGILVWQDFMFACAMYPGDDAFLESVKGEAIDNVRRLRNHPCIALWCGNNEIDEGWHHWGWQRQYGYSSADSTKIWGDYRKIFLELLPGVVERYDGTRPYWPSSPSHGRAEPASLTEGDSHYWGVWHDGEPFAAFNEKIPRFMSEFGVESFPSLPAIMHFSRPGDWRLDSEVMVAHQKAARGDEILRSYMARDYRVPEDFRSFVYVSQLVQADAVKTAIEAERRAKPYCMGSLFWQLDDCWPGPSWSCIDYYGNPKAAYYRARDAMSNILVSPVLNGDSLLVYIVSDSSETVHGFLKLQLLDFSGKISWADLQQVEIPPSSSDLYFKLDTRIFLANVDSTKVVLSAEVLTRDKPLSRNLCYFVAPKDLDLPKPNFAPSFVPAEAGRPGGVLSIRLSSKVFVKDVYLSMPGIEGYFDDNFFDMLPGTVVSVQFIPSERTDISGARVAVTSFADVR